MTTTSRSSLEKGLPPSPLRVARQVLQHRPTPSPRTSLYRFDRLQPNGARCIKRPGHALKTGSMERILNRNMPGPHAATTLYGTCPNLLGQAPDHGLDIVRDPVAGSDVEPSVGVAFSASTQICAQRSVKVSNGHHAPERNENESDPVTFPQCVSSILNASLMIILTRVIQRSYSDRGPNVQDLASGTYATSRVSSCRKFYVRSHFCIEMCRASVELRVLHNFDHSTSTLHGQTRHGRRIRLISGFADEPGTTRMRLSYASSIIHRLLNWFFKTSRPFDVELVQGETRLLQGSDVSVFLLLIWKLSLELPSRATKLAELYNPGNRPQQIIRGDGYERPSFENPPRNRSSEEAIREGNSQGTFVQACADAPQRLGEAIEIVTRHNGATRKSTTLEAPGQDGGSDIGEARRPGSCNEPRAAMPSLRITPIVSRTSSSEHDRTTPRDESKSSDLVTFIGSNELPSRDPLNAANHVPYRSCAAHEHDGGAVPSENGLSDSVGTGQPMRKGKKRTRTSNKDDEGPGRSQQDRDDFDSLPGRAMFACIFHVGEPDIYPDHLRKYEYIAQLLRHLKSHGFYACQYCFRSFSSASLAKEHRCLKSCSNSLCRRRVAEMADRPILCDCVTTAEAQWQQLYKLKYPAHRSPVSDHEQHFSLSGGSETLSGPANTSFEIAPNVDRSTSSLPPMPIITLTRRVNDRTPRHHGESAVAEMGTPQISAHLRTLQQRTLLLEQRLLPRPTQREDDLEITLANVWQAFCRTGSSEAQQDSPLWRLVRRHAPNVVSREITHSAAQAVTVLLPTTSTSDEQDAFDWSQLLADDSSQNSSWRGSAIDSGYASFSGA